MAARTRRRIPQKRADQLLRFAKTFPDSEYALPALELPRRLTSRRKIRRRCWKSQRSFMKDPNNLGMLLLVSDYYGEKGEQLDKAESYAQKAATLAHSVQRPANVTEDQWKQQTALQKGLALSTLGQINLQKRTTCKR